MIFLTITVPVWRTRRLQLSSGVIVRWNVCVSSEVVQPIFTSTCWGPDASPGSEPGVMPTMCAFGQSSDWSMTAESANVPSSSLHATDTDTSSACQPSATPTPTTALVTRPASSSAATCPACLAILAPLRGLVARSSPWSLNRRIGLLTVNSPFAAVAVRDPGARVPPQSARRSLSHSHESDGMGADSGGGNPSNECLERGVRHPLGSANRP